MIDYSHIDLKITTFTEGCEPKIHLDHGYAPLYRETNPLDYFINAEEAFMLFSDKGIRWPKNIMPRNVVQLWKRTGEDSVTVASVAIRYGYKIDARSLVKLLRECVDTPQIADVATLFKDCRIVCKIVSNLLEQLGKKKPANQPVLKNSIGL